VVPVAHPHGRGPSGGPARRRGRVARLFGAAAALILALPAGPSRAEPPRALSAAEALRCQYKAAQHPFLPDLPNARRSVQAGGSLKIVALGSSATAGAGASGEDESYPAMLRAELRRRLPDVEVEVLNRGVGGQSAYDMVMRMDADAVAERPALVIWQTLATDALRHVGEDKAARILRKGIGKIREAGIDLVLMDLAWLPREERYPHYDDYRAVLARTAAELGVAVFPRHAIMRAWARSKQFSYEELVGMDGVHLVNAASRCLATRLAEGIVAAVTQGAAAPTRGARLD
jgi:lysophospholipase L1-like esterase